LTRILALTNGMKDFKQRVRAKGVIKLYLVWCTLPVTSSLSSGLALRGHSFKLYKRYNSCRIRSFFFTERVINIWNKLPVSIMDFRTLSSFKKSLHRIDLTDLLADA